MKVVVFIAIVGLAAALPLPQEEEVVEVVQTRQEQSILDSVPILEDSRNGPDGDGNFDFRYETGDGIVHEARGANSGDGIVRVSGRFSYLSPEGEPIDISYIADENGFQAFGDALPTPPPMPPHAVAQLRAAEEAFLEQDLPARAPTAVESGGRLG
ncbi:Insect cuticle protein [Trinorchestia longiramus]|nr:Insect cuticle protein [Trinorchestia longiramus]